MEGGAGGDKHPTLFKSSTVLPVRRSKSRIERLGNIKYSLGLSFVLQRGDGCRRRIDTTDQVENTRASASRLVHIIMDTKIEYTSSLEK